MTSAPASTAIVLVICPPWEVLVPPLGIAYLGTYLRSHGHSVEVVDLNLRLFRAAPPDLKEFWSMRRGRSWTDPRELSRLAARLEAGLTEGLAAIMGSGAPTIGFSVNSGNIFFSLEVVRRIKAMDPARTIVFGGPGVFAINARNQLMSLEIAEIARYHQVDFFVLGDGEERLRWLLEARSGGGAPEELPPGIIAHPEQLIHERPAALPAPRLPAPRLQDIPFPTFVEFDLTEYLELSPDPFLPVLSSRGCNRRCRFCNDCHISPAFRALPPPRVAEALRFYRREYGVRRFCFNDLLINGSLEKLGLLCQLIVEDREPIEWWGQAVVRREMSEGWFELLRRAGCTSLVFGVESFSDAVLKQMNKPYTAREAVDLLRGCFRAGIPPAINLIVGYPGEGEEEFAETCNILEEHQDAFYRVASLSTCCLNGGSDLFALATSLGISFPAGDEPHLKWSIPGTSDLATRMGRVRHLAALLARLGKPVDFLAPDDDPE